MRVVFPWTAPHPLAEAKLAELVPTAERRYVGTRNDAYWQLFCDLWKDGESFLIIEQDVEVHERALRQALHCSCQWGASVYHGPGGIEFTTGLGFTRFRSPLITTEPDLPFAAAELNDATDIGQRGWQRLDTRISGILRERGYEPHVHRPAVAHHHVYCGICACGAEHEDYPIDQDGRYRRPM